MLTDTRAGYRSRSGHRSGDSWSEGATSTHLASEWHPFRTPEPFSGLPAGGGDNVGLERSEYGGRPAHLSVFRQGYSTVQLTQERPKPVRQVKPRHASRTQSRSATLDTSTLARPPPRSVEQRLPRPMERVSPPLANRRERRTESQPPRRPCVVNSLGTRVENRKAFVGQKQEKSVEEKTADEKSVNADEVLYRDIEQIYFKLSLPIQLMDMDPDRTPEKLQMKANLQAKIFPEIKRRETEALEKWKRANPGREFRGLRDPRWEHAALVEQIHYWREHVAIASGTT